MTIFSSLTPPKVRVQYEGGFTDFYGNGDIHAKVTDEYASLPTVWAEDTIKFLNTAHFYYGAMVYFDQIKEKFGDPRIYWTIDNTPVAIAKNKAEGKVYEETKITEGMNRLHDEWYKGLKEKGLLP